MLRSLRTLAALAALLAAPAAARAQAVDLVGTWHVLVHYQDSQSHKPDAWRWNDRVWQFEMEGSRLRWSDYPIVVFRDESGRFEKLGTNRQARVVGAWEPNADQLDQIREGLEVNPRGSKTKTLRGSPAEGWRSATPRGPMSAGVLSYDVTWSIEDPRSRPVFRIEESLGGAGAESLEGVTLYTTTSVEQGGDVLRGSFNRDGTRVGDFRLMRSGSVGAVKGRSEKAGYSGGVQAIMMRGIASSQAFGEAVAKPAGPGVDERGVRRAVYDAVVEVASASLDQNMLPVFADDITDQVMVAWKKGASERELRDMLRNGEIKSNLSLLSPPR